MDIRQAILAAGNAQDDQAWTRLLDVLEVTAVGVPLGDDASQLVFRTEPGDVAPTFFAFTDVESAEAWDGPASQWAQVPLPKLCRMIRGTTDARLTLNSGGPATVTLDPGSIGYLAAIAEPADDRVSLEIPSAAVPDEFVSAVRRVLFGYPTIAAAYVVAVRTADESHWGIAVRADDSAEFNAAVEGLRSAVAKAIPAWHKVDVIPLTEPMEKALVRAGLPSVLELTHR
jgi:type III secretion system (T3SS) SseB-like protein